MSQTGDGRVILATFAGRRDRMELLTWYAEAALARGDIDEWHVWDYTRDAADAAWLRAKFPCVRLTPGEGDSYFLSRSRMDFLNGSAHFRFSVSASNDVHLGLRRVLGSGDSYEIVLGGWNNQASAIRSFPEAGMVTDFARRGTYDQPAIVVASPHILPEYDMVEVLVEIGPGYLRACVGGRIAVEYRGVVEPGAFEILYRSGFGCNAEWRLPDMPDRGAFRFQSALPEKVRDNPDISRFVAFYQHYARNSLTYAQDVFLKCDDDIVFIDLERLRDFVAFRRHHKQYLLVSANVLNNGVCAYFQQQDGLIPKELMELEMPPAGFGGTLWSSAEKAAALHRHFVADPDRFRGQSREATEWRDRISINFVGMLGADFAHVSDIMFDDEEFLSYQARWRARKANVIYAPFVVSHLSFYPQDAGMRIGEIVGDYRALAERAGVIR